MSWSANADEFDREFRSIIGNYRQHHVAEVKKLREGYLNQLGLDPADPVAQDPELFKALAPEFELLEEHVCLFLLTAALRALNWTLDGRDVAQLPLQAFMREAPLKSMSDADLRLDYFGYLTSGKPLLVLEAKRPAITLPAPGSGIKSSWDRRSWIADVFLKTLQDPTNPVTDGWGKYLEKARKYVEAVKKDFGEAPRRFVLTNGDWFVVFTDPDKAFLNSASAQIEEIRVFLSRDDVLHRYREFFEFLNFFSLLPPYTAIKKPQLFSEAEVKEATHIYRGMLVRYEGLEPVEGHQPPYIRVQPVIFLAHPSGHLIRVEETDAVASTFELRQAPEEIQKHLKEVATQSDVLWNAAVAANSGLIPGTLSEFYSSGQSFAAQKGSVVKVQPGRWEPNATFALVLGEHIHFLRPPPTPPACPSHAASSCGTKALPIVRLPSITPQSFFADGSPYHCAHLDTGETKRTAVTSKPGQRRSRSEFCELAVFEQRLCCRTCVFLDICATMPAFQMMPCSDKTGP